MHAEWHHGKSAAARCGRPPRLRVNVETGVLVLSCGLELHDAAGRTELIQGLSVAVNGRGAIGRRLHQTVRIHRNR